MKPAPASSDPAKGRGPAPGRGRPARRRHRSDRRGRTAGRSPGWGRRRRGAGPGGAARRREEGDRRPSAKNSEKHRGRQVARRASARSRAGRRLCLPLCTRPESASAPSVRAPAISVRSRSAPGRPSRRHPGVAVGSGAGEPGPGPDSPPAGAGRGLPQASRQAPALSGFALWLAAVDVPRPPPPAAVNGPRPWLRIDGTGWRRLGGGAGALGAELCAQRRARRRLARAGGRPHWRAPARRAWRRPRPRGRGPRAGGYPSRSRLVGRQRAGGGGGEEPSPPRASVAAARSGSRGAIGSAMSDSSPSTKTSFCFRPIVRFPSAIRRGTKGVRYPPPMDGGRSGGADKPQP